MRSLLVDLGQVLDWVGWADDARPAHGPAGTGSGGGRMSPDTPAGGSTHSSTQNSGGGGGGGGLLSSQSTADSLETWGSGSSRNPSGPSSGSGSSRALVDAGVAGSAVGQRAVSLGVLQQLAGAAGGGSTLAPGIGGSGSAASASACGSMSYDSQVAGGGSAASMGASGWRSSSAAGGDSFWGGGTGAAARVAGVLQDLHLSLERRLSYKSCRLLAFFVTR